MASMTSIKKNFRWVGLILVKYVFNEFFIATFLRKNIVECQYFTRHQASKEASK
jgi:hypothetical protein